MFDSCVEASEELRVAKRNSILVAGFADNIKFIFIIIVIEQGNDITNNTIDYTDPSASSGWEEESGKRAQEKYSGIEHTNRRGKSKGTKKTKNRNTLQGKTLLLDIPSPSLLSSRYRTCSIDKLLGSLLRYIRFRRFPLLPSLRTP